MMEYYSKTPVLAIDAATVLISGNPDDVRKELLVLSYSGGLWSVRIDHLDVTGRTIQSEYHSSPWGKAYLHRFK